MSQPILAVIGGSGIYDLEQLTDLEEIAVTTPFGPPSSPIVRGRVADTPVLFIARHGQGHTISPSEINFRANIHALKQQGATHLLSICAVGSLREEIAPGDLVAVDQFIDKTVNRPASFFGDGVVAHVMFADPVCNMFKTLLVDQATANNFKIHNGGTMCVMEGPQFSTRAESNMHRQWGADLIGMTALPEAKLAREAELCYTTLALATDYDCWYPHHGDVTVDEVMKTMQNNVHKAKQLVVSVAQALPQTSRACECHTALSNAIMTSSDKIPAETKEKLQVIARRVL